MAMKEQERQAIQKIRKIVEGMGKNSYLATVMDGVLETAEENIEYDAAFSLKGRVEVAEKEAAELKKENEELRKVFSEMEGRLAKLAEENARYSKEYERLKAYTIPDWMQQELEKLVQTEIERVKREIRDAADGMAYVISDDGIKEEQEAVEQAKKYRKSRTEEITLKRIQEFLRRYAGGEQD